MLLGLREGAHNDAYKKVKVQAQTSLKKAARKAVIWKAAIRRAIGVAQELEQQMPGTRYDRGPIGVTMNDGIPLDELDEANRIAILRRAGSMSLRRSVEEQLNDPAAVEAELDELERENAAKTPTVLLNEPGVPPGGGGAGGAGGTPAGLGPTPAEEETEAAAGANDAGQEVAA